jgi:hypothetical protein
LALSLKRRDKWGNVKSRVKAVRRSELEGRDAFVRLAEATYLRIHPHNDH